MAQIFPDLTDKLQAWIGEQKMFFVSTAPLAADGLVNCSPKGLDTLRIVGPREVVYLDLVGSGVETIADLKENGRIVLMFCSFGSAPRIVRLHGKGSVFEKGSDEFVRYEKLFAPFINPRSVIHVEVTRISDSCGYGVPMYEYIGQRDMMRRWAEAKGEEGLREYVATKNAESINGLPGVERAE